VGILGLQETIGAGVDTDAALDAFALVKDGDAVLQGYGALLAVLHAGAAAGAEAGNAQRTDPADDPDLVQERTVAHVGAAGYGDAEPYREFPPEDPSSPSQSLDGLGFTERFYLVLRKQALVMIVVPYLFISPGYRSRFRTMLQRSQR